MSSVKKKVGIVSTLYISTFLLLVIFQQSIVESLAVGYDVRSMLFQHHSKKLSLAGPKISHGSQSDLFHNSLLSLPSSSSPKNNKHSCRKDIFRLRAGAVAVGELGFLNTFIKRSPYLAAFFICGIKACAADWIAQKAEAKKKLRDNAESSFGLGSTFIPQGGGSIAIEKVPTKTNFNFQRSLAFVLYGGGYQGCFQEFMYNTLFPMWFGNGTGPLVVAAKVLFDILILSPFLCLPVAYLIKSLIFRYSFGEALSRYVSDVKNNGLLTKFWMLWGPVQCLTFGIIPDHLKISFIAGVSFFWLIILSSISSKSDSDVDVSEERLILEGAACSNS